MKIKNLSILLIIITFISSCSNNDENLMSGRKTLDFKFESLNTNAKNTSNQENYSVTIISISPLVIESKYLEVIEVTIADTNETSYAIVKKQNNQNNKNNISYRGGCEASIERGFWYDGSGCFLYGTIINDSNCGRTFFPASVETQYMFNECGWA
jgi:hypothetical protein